MDLSLLVTLTSRDATYKSKPPWYTTTHRFVRFSRFPLTSCIHDCTYMFSPNELVPEIVTDVTAGDACTRMWRGLTDSLMFTCIWR